MLYEVMQNPELAGAASARILESLQSPVLVIDAGGEISYANATAAVSLGGWIVGLSLSEIFPDYLKTPTLGDGPSCMRLRSRQGELYEALFNPVGDGNICLSMWAISETAVFKEPVKIDDLTGLALRNTLMTNLEVALLEPDQAGASAAILCLDLDRFKLINDTLGHGIGDQLLKKVSERLKKACRKDDVIARMGGDEFVILQRGIAGAADAERLAERLVDLVSRT